MNIDSKTNDDDAPLDDVVRYLKEVMPLIDPKELGVDIADLGGSKCMLPSRFHILASGGELTQAETAHLASCERCQQLASRVSEALNGKQNAASKPLQTVELDAVPVVEENRPSIQSTRPNLRWRNLSILVAATLLLAVGVRFLFVTADPLPTTRPSAAYATIARQDQLSMASGEGMEPETNHLATAAESRSYWSIFICDSRGILKVNEGRAGEKGKAGLFLSPPHEVSEYVYIVTIATHEECPDLLQCLKAALTKEQLDRLQTTEFVMADESGDKAAELFTELADKCKCTRGLSTVSVQRRTISEAP